MVNIAIQDYRITSNKLHFILSSVIRDEDGNIKLGKDGKERTSSDTYHKSFPDLLGRLVNNHVFESNEQFTAFSECHASLSNLIEDITVAMQDFTKSLGEYRPKDFAEPSHD